MKPKNVLLIAALVIGTMFAPAVTFAEILTFDDLLSSKVPVPNGYGGLNWNNIDYLNGVTQDIPSGYNNAVVSRSNVVYNNFGQSAQITGSAFNLNSAYLTGAWNDGLHVEVQGFVGSTLTYDNTYTVNTTGPTLITFNYLGVDEVNFISSGGTPHPSYVGLGQGTQFAMDNLDVTFVPEPAACALVGLGAVALLGFCRYKGNRYRLNAF